MQVDPLWDKGKISHTAHTGGGGISGGENFAGKISPLTKVAKFLQVSTVNSDMRSGVPSREKGPGMFLFATCSGCARNALECLVAPGSEKKIGIGRYQENDNIS